MRRKLSLIGFILGTSFSAIYAFIMIIGSIELLSVISELPGEYMAILVVELALAITTLVLNCVSIPTTTTAQKMNKKKGVVITTIVFNFVSVILYIFSIINSVSVGFTMIYILLALGLIAANVLAIIDLAKLKNAVEQENNQENNVIEPQETQKDAKPDYKDAMDSLEAEIGKLVAMKEKNFISEEEFEKLKNNAIQKRL